MSGSDEEAEDEKSHRAAATAAAVAAKARQLQHDLRLQERANKSMAFELERQRLVRVSIWFYILLIPSIVFTFGAYTKGSYVWTALNGFGFLLVWRSLYAKQNALWFIVSAIILGLTIKNV